MQGFWNLKFDFKEGNNSIELELQGDAQMIRVGLETARLQLGNRLQKRFGTGTVPDGLMMDALLLNSITNGAPLRLHQGKFLTIEEAQNSALVQSIAVEWED